VRRIALVAATITGLVLSVSSADAWQVPDRIPLPNGFQPEGIAIAEGTTFYTGSLIDGSIYRGDLRTGVGDIFVEPQPGRISVGMKVHKAMLYVAGGDTGDGYVYDTRTGSTVRTYHFNDGAFINDVIVTKDAAWFTDSFLPFLYRVPVSPNGTPADASEVEAIPLSGDIQYQEGFNVNGIDATPDGRTLVVVQTNTGELFTVEPSSGLTARIDLGGGSVVFGDGILLDGKELFVVQGFMNVVAKVSLDPRLTSGDIVSQTADEDFDVPTTVAEAGKALYLPNARFTTPPTPDTEYWITPIPKP
jgi:hypothetical protein